MASTTRKKVFRVFKIWVAASFDVRTVEVATFCYPGSPHKTTPLVKIGLGEHPSCPASQLIEELGTPIFQMQTDPEGQSSKDSLILLLDKPPQIAATTKTRAALALDLTRATASTTPTTTSASSPLRLPSYLPVKLSQQFNIASPNKPKVAMELTFEMDTP
jgi:hypothetical protein